MKPQPLPLWPDQQPESAAPDAQDLAAPAVAAPTDSADVASEVSGTFDCFACWAVYIIGAKGGPGPWYCQCGALLVMRPAGAEPFEPMGDYAPPPGVTPLADGSDNPQSLIGDRAADDG